MRSVSDAFDVVVVGAGLAGLVTTLELLERGDQQRILLVDRCAPHEVGGLAREAFGGMFMVDTREQRFSRIRDSVDLALADWLRVAEFEDEDDWPRRWAQEYVARARDEVGDWLKSYGVRFFPVVNWAERGVYGDGNSVPRFHLTWGCGQALVDAVWDAIQRHPSAPGSPGCCRKAAGWWGAGWSLRRGARVPRPRCPAGRS
jgi:hypothetical protein